MATLATILDVETEVEGVFYAYLTTNLGIASAPIESDSNTETMTPRLEVIATRQSEGWHQTTIAAGTFAGRTLYDQSKVKLDINLVYNPAASQGQASLRGTMRKLLTDFEGLKTQFAVNGFYFLAPEQLRQTGGNRVIDNEEKTETITTELELELFIAPSALTGAT